jgi:hypothetical protein
MNSLVSYQLVAWKAATHRLQLMEATLFDSALMPLLLESELDDAKTQTIIEEIPVVYNEAFEALEKAITNCRSNKLCDQTSVLKVYHDYESAVTCFDIQISRLNRWRDSTNCAQGWMYELQSLSKMTTHAWIQSTVSLLSSLSTTQPNLEFDIKPQIRQTDRLQTLMGDCELCVMRDIHYKVYTICYRFNNDKIDLLNRLMIISKSLHDILIDHANLPSSSTPLVHKIVQEALHCVSHSLAMKNYWIGLYIGDISPQSCAHHELATILSDIASLGRIICSYRRNANSSPQEEEQFYLEFYSLGKTLCHELQTILVGLTSNHEKKSPVLGEYTLHMARFKPLLQIYYGQDQLMKGHFKSHIVVSLSKFTDSIYLRINNSSNPEGILLLKTLNRIYNECAPNNVHDATFELLVYQQLLNIAKGLQFRHSTAKEDLQKVIKLWNQWMKLNRSYWESKMILPLRQLLKINMFILLLENNINNSKRESETLWYGDSDKRVPKFKPKVQRITSNIPCDQLYDKLHQVLDQLDTNSTNRTQTNLEMLSTYLFWVEKTLEVQMMRYELITPIEGLVKKESVKLSETCLDALLGSLEWIEEKGMYVSAMSSIFKLAFIDKEVTDHDALAWLDSEPIFSFSSSCGPEEQIRAIQCMKEVALKWKAEYTTIVDKDIQEETLTKDRVHSLPSVFSLFCK